MVFIETSVFLRRIQELLSEHKPEALENILIYQPDIGKLIPRSGGLRKVR